MSDPAMVGDLVALAPAYYSLFPPILALGLALITKNVVLSLAAGIFLGTLIYVIVTKSSFVGILSNFFIIMAARMDLNVIFFTSILGGVIFIMALAGGTQAYGRWSQRTIRSKVHAQLGSFLLGLMLFFDDYFGCMALGTVMKPVYDSMHLSREKLAFVVDSMSASLCVIVPISSWAAVILTSLTEDGTGTGAMIQFANTIPYNFYALNTILITFMVTATRYNYGPMVRFDEMAERRGEALNTDDSKEEGAAVMTDEEINQAMLEAPSDELATVVPSDKGRIYDLVVPILFLMVMTILLIVYLGGGFDGTNKSASEIFGESNTSLALSMASLLTLVLTGFMYLPRKLMTFNKFMTGFTDGMKVMVPITLILILAWGIGGVTRLLQTGEYLGNAIRSSSFPTSILPFIIFVIAGILSFSIGTAWGTFGILLPIINNICRLEPPNVLAACQAAVLSGSIFGDHSSPISDTTVLSSTGSGCNHMNHVISQLPYAITSALVAAIAFLVSGLSKCNPYVGLPLSLVLMVLLVSSLFFLSHKGYLKWMDGGGKRAVPSKTQTVADLNKKSVIVAAPTMEVVIADTHSLPSSPLVEEDANSSPTISEEETTPRL